MKRICYIVGAGDNSGTHFRREENDYVIAADGGLVILQQMGIEPDMIMGDFDSLGFVPEGKNVVRHKVEKNDTDMMLAVKKAVDLGFRHIRIYGGTGGRMDHTIANFQTLLYGSLRNIDITMIDAENEYKVVTDGNIELKAREKGTFSLFAIGGAAYKVNITGAMYLLCDFDLYPDNPTGVSNSFIGETVKVTVESGSLLVIVEKMQFSKKY